MNKLSVLALLTVLFLLASFPAAAEETKGSNITVKGEVLIAVADERTGQLYELFPGENETMPDRIKVGENIAVVGTRTTRKGHTAIRIEKIDL